MHIKDQTYLAKLGFADKDKKNPLHDAACLYLTQPDKLRKLVKLCFPDEYKSTLIKPAAHEYELLTCRHLDTLAAEEVLNKAYWESDHFESIKDSLGYHAKSKSRAETKIVWEDPDETRDIVCETGVSTPLEHRTPGYSTHYGFRPEVVQIKGYYDLTIDITFQHRGTKYTKAYIQAEERIDIPAEYVNAPQRVAKHSHAGLMVEVKAGPVSVNEILQQLRTYSQYDADRVQVVATLFRMDAFSRDQLTNHGIYYIYIDPATVAAFRKKIGQETEVAEF